MFIPARDQYLIAEALNQRNRESRRSMEPGAIAPEAPQSEQNEGQPTEAPATGRKRLGKADLEQRRPRKTELVYLPERDGEVEVQELRPGETAEINAKCLVKKPHSDQRKANAGEMEVDWDGRKRTFYMIAKALRNEKGHPVYPGDNYLYGCEIVANEYSQQEHDLLWAAVQRVSGIDKEAREAAGKGSGATRTGDSS